jgi:hypothetical protein
VGRAVVETRRLVNVGARPFFRIGRTGRMQQRRSAIAADQVVPVFCSHSPRYASWVEGAVLCKLHSHPRLRNERRGSAGPGTRKRPVCVYVALYPARP